VPFIITVQNGNADGTFRVRKGWVTLNGQQLLAPPLIGNGHAGYILAIHPQQQNQLDIRIKGGDAGSFIRVSIGPTPGNVLNNPGSPGFDSSEQGLGTPYGVSVDQTRHVAYVADRFYDTVFAFDIAGARIASSFTAVDGDQVNGDGGTTSVCFLPGMGIMAANEGEQGAAGSISVIKSRHRFRACG